MDPQSNDSDNSAREQSIAAGHEPETASVQGIVLGVLGLSLLVLCALGLIWGLLRWLQSGGPPQGAVAPPVDIAPQQLREPALNANQPIMLRELRASEHAQLTTYGWIDRDAGVARIPIDRAMQIVAQDGLPRWPQAPDETSDEVQPPGEAKP